MFARLLDLWPSRTSNWAVKQMSRRDGVFILPEPEQASAAAVRTQANSVDGHGAVCFGQAVFIQSIRILRNDGWTSAINENQTSSGTALLLSKGSKRYALVYLPHWGGMTTFTGKASRRHLPLAFQMGLFAFYAFVLKIREACVAQV